MGGSASSLLGVPGWPMTALPGNAPAADTSKHISNKQQRDALSVRSRCDGVIKLKGEAVRGLHSRTASNPNHGAIRMVEATHSVQQAQSDAQRQAAVGSYRERMATARAAASAARRQSARRGIGGLSYVEVRRIALAAVKATIRDRGDKLSLYSLAQLRAQADAMIGPWFVAQARPGSLNETRRYVQCERPATQGLLLNETHAQNGAGK